MVARNAGRSSRLSTVPCPSSKILASIRALESALGVGQCARVLAPGEGREGAARCDAAKEAVVAGVIQAKWDWERHLSIELGAPLVLRLDEPVQAHVLGRRVASEGRGRLGDGQGTNLEVIGAIARNRRRGERGALADRLIDGGGHDVQ